MIQQQMNIMKNIITIFYIHLIGEPTDPMKLQFKMIMEYPEYNVLEDKVKIYLQQ